jgi:hypothetical protein
VGTRVRGSLDKGILKTSFLTAVLFTTLLVLVPRCQRRSRSLECCHRLMLCRCATNIVCRSDRHIGSVPSGGRH